MTLAAVAFAVQVDGVYSTRANVVFLAPTALTNNTLRDTSESLVNFAGVVEREYNGNAVPARFSSPTATLYGAGVRSGHAVSLVNTGGQWKDSFVNPVLAVEVVGASAGEVREQLADIVGDINALAAAQQDEATVAAVDRITTLTSPQAPVVEYADGSRTRAIAAIVLLGLALGGVATAFVDRVLSRPLRAKT